ncbi:hypothetical protein ACHBTE_29935 [Streptomyces sp. M41]|uniref:hypothetical protein n=1 Tax=Streptomyces sp. M41 TaxID=3059412 RepID=UPI00374D7A09
MLDGAYRSQLDPTPCPYCASLLASSPAVGAAPDAERIDGGYGIVGWLRVFMALIAGVSVVLTLAGAWAG